MSNRMRPPRRGAVELTISCVLCLCASIPAWGADVSIKPGDRVITVDIQNQTQLDTLLNMNLDIWSHGVGVGPVDVHVSTAERQAIEAAGLTYTVAIDDLVAVHAASQGGPQPHGAGFFDDYHDLDEIVTFINDLATARPDLAEVFSIGQSVEGREIWVLHVTGSTPGPKPGVFYHSLQHAREWITGPTVLYLADHLINNYDTDPCIQDLVNRTDFYLAPCVNPDGYAFTHAPGGQRLWRKNRRQNSPPPNASYGVDLNRNWAYGWGGPGASGDPDNDLYYGPSPFSEPETTALSNFVNSNPSIRAYMDYHNYGELILWPFGGTCTEPPEPDASTFWVLGTSMQSLIQGVHGIGYVHGPICQTLYQASGASVDWNYGTAGRFAFTIELRPDSSNPGFLLPPGDIIPTCEENLPAILHLSQWAASDILIDLPQGAPNIVASAGPTEIPVTISESWDTYSPGTGTLHYRFAPGDPFSTSPLVSQGGADYTATIPAGPCGSTVEYYVTAESDGGFAATAPCNPPTNVFAALVIDSADVVRHDFETEPGWTASNLGASSGDWQRGVPVDDPGWDYDPAADGDGSGSCYLTQNENGNTDVDGGTVQLLSPTIDMSGGGDYSVEYEYYLRMTDSSTDLLLVEANNADGVGPWTEVARHETDGGLSWRHHAISQADLDNAGVTLTNEMRFRFSANDADPQSIVEAGLDGFAVVTLDCPAAPCPGVLGDLTGEGDINGLDIGPFLSAYLTAPFFDPCADLASPSGGTLDSADLDAFVAALLLP